MEPGLEITFVAAKCSKTKQGFGIRLEKRFSSKWTATWAFKRGEKGLSEFSDSAAEITGGVLLGQPYPGCPHCRGMSFVCCGSCQKVSCWDQVSKQYVCPHCLVSAEIEGEIEKLKSVADG